MFHFSYSFIISPSLLEFISALALAEGGVTIACCKWVKNLYIKECTLLITSPEILSYNVKADSVFSVSWSHCKPLTCHWLQARFSANSMTHLCQKFSCNIFNIIVWMEGKPAREQLIVCSTVNFWSQTQREGSCFGHHPYLRQRASR